MAVGYRSIFSLRHGQDAVRLTAEQFRSWLALKGYGFVTLAREEFLAAVTGDPESVDCAEEVVSTRLQAG